MVYAPGHFHHTAPRRRRCRSRREQFAVRAAGLVALALIGVVVFSLTNRQRTSAKGCVDFNYTTMIGGAETYRCGAEARALCATPPSGRSLDTDFQAQLYAACHRAGLPTGRTRSGSAARS